MSGYHSQPAIDLRKSQLALQDRKDKTLAALVRWFDGMPHPDMQDAERRQIEQLIEIQNIVSQARELCGFQISNSVKEQLSSLENEN